MAEYNQATFFRRGNTVIKKGKLVRWNDSKGYGFIRLEVEADNEVTQDIFMHMSALEPMTRRPLVGDTIYFQIEAQTKNAFEVADFVVKQTKIIKELEKDAAPEAISKVENVHELLNGVKDFIDEQSEEPEDGEERKTDTSLAYFLEDVALATDLDNEKDKHVDSVSLMTVHMAKGLEFQYVYIVGLEENLFPSAMSMNTRSELEEERRLFYVALTRAEKVAYLSYAQTRYRWGKLVDAEPSRFLEEIDDQFLHYITPKTPEPSINRFVDKSIFDDAPKGIRFQKPIQRKKMERDLAKKKEIIIPKNLKKVSQATSKPNLFDENVVVGNIVEHNRFGAGEVIALEGKGPNKKAEIKFSTVGKKKLLLQFAKLKVIG